MKPAGRPAVFLDGDGVLIEGVYLVTNPDGLRIIEVVPQALRSLKEAGFRLVVISLNPKHWPSRRRRS